MNTSTVKRFGIVVPGKGRPDPLAGTRLLLASIAMGFLFFVAPSGGANDKAWRLGGFGGAGLMLIWSIILIRGPRAYRLGLRTSDGILWDVDRNEGTSGQFQFRVGPEPSRQVLQSISPKEGATSVGAMAGAQLEITLRKFTDSEYHIGKVYLAGRPAYPADASRKVFGRYLDLGTNSESRTASQKNSLRWGAKEGGYTYAVYGEALELVANDEVTAIRCADTTATDATAENKTTERLYADFRKIGGIVKRVPPGCVSVTVVVEPEQVRPRERATPGPLSTSVMVGGIAAAAVGLAPVVGALAANATAGAFPRSPADVSSRGNLEMRLILTGAWNATDNLERIAQDFCWTVQAPRGNTVVSAGGATGLRGGEGDNTRGGENEKAKSASLNPSSLATLQYPQHRFVYNRR
jgi:hypothetical protein